MPTNFGFEKAVVLVLQCERGAIHPRDHSNEGGSAYKVCKLNMVIRLPFPILRSRLGAIAFDGPNPVCQDFISDAQTGKLWSPSPSSTSCSALLDGRWRCSYNSGCRWTRHDICVGLQSLLQTVPIVSRSYMRMPIPRKILYELSRDNGILSIT